MNSRNILPIVAFLLIVLGVMTRLLPHEPNFTSVAAVALFGAVYLRPKYAILLPLVILVISDAVIGFDSFQGRAMVYGSFVAIGLIGLAVRRHKSFATILGGTVAGSVLFYIITNFAFFYPPTMYPHDLSGIIASYYNAIPFFRNMLMGDLFYVGLLFGSYELAAYFARRKPQLSNVRETA